MRKIALNGKMAFVFVVVCFCGYFLILLINNGCTLSPVAGQAGELENPSKNSAKSTLIIDRPQILSAAFYGTQFAWVLVKEKNCIFYTDDGGRNWQALLNGIPQSASKLSFIDSRNGWLVSDIPDTGLEVWQTTNGGAEWKKLAQLKTSPMQSSFTNADAVHFVDSQNGWILETTSVWKTNDGGNNWEDVSPLIVKNLGEQPIKIAFNNHKTWLIGSNGSLFFTDSGGKSWRKKTIVKGLSIVDMFFSTSESGWVISEDGQLFLTQDGGNTWQRQQDIALSNNIVQISSLFFLDTKDGWAIGMNSSHDGKCENKDLSKFCTIVQHTKDGGQSWQKVNIESTGSFSSSIIFTDKDHGWFISSDNIYSTNDAGISWHKVLLR